MLAGESLCCGGSLLLKGTLLLGGGHRPGETPLHARELVLELCSDGLREAALLGDLLLCRLRSALVFHEGTAAVGERVLRVGHCGLGLTEIARGGLQVSLLHRDLLRVAGQQHRQPRIGVTVDVGVYRDGSKVGTILRKGRLGSLDRRRRERYLMLKLRDKQMGLVVALVQHRELGVVGLDLLGQLCGLLLQARNRRSSGTDRR